MSSRSSAHRFTDDALRHVAQGVVSRVAHLEAPIVLIDGRSGAGKTSLAHAVASLSRMPGKVLSLDDVYPGWDGLEAATRLVAEEILPALRAGRAARWRGWDWERSAPGSWHIAEPGGLWVIEGCGALTADTRRNADWTVWVDGPEAVRKQRALARDGEGYAPWWDRWADQESAHIADHAPQNWADEEVSL